MHELEKVLSSLATGIGTEPVRTTGFTASVTSISLDHSSIRVKLCTGASLDVPTALLKNLTHLGTVSQESERWGLVSSELDISTAAGMVIRQMADEITRLCRLLEARRERSARAQGPNESSRTATVEGPSGKETRPTLEPADKQLGPQTFKMPFQGVAGAPVTLRYDTPPNQYIAVPFVGHPTWSVSNFNNCFFTRPPLLADPFGFNTWIEFFCEAAHGTPIGQRYTASFWLTVELNQRTT